MELFVPSKNRDSVTCYRLLKNDWKSSVITGATDWFRDVKPTVIKKEYLKSDAPYRTDIFYFSGDSDIYVLDYRGKECVGRSLASNVGVASNGCDHYYEDDYKYSYYKNYFIRGLASAIRCYYDALDFDVASARLALNRIKKCIDCTSSDVYYMYKILESLSFTEERKFTNLEDLAYFIFNSDRDDIEYYLKYYKEAIQGLSIADVCSNVTSSDSYIISKVKRQLCDSEKGEDLMAFLPEVKAEKEELARILWK